MGCINVQKVDDGAAPPPMHGGYPPAGYGYGAPPPANYGGYSQPPQQGGHEKRGRKEKQEPVEPNPRLYVGGLPLDVDKNTIDYVFKSYGVIEEIFLCPQKADGGDRCSALVRYTTTEEAEACVAAMEAGYEIRPGQGNI